MRRIGLLTIAVMVCVGMPVLAQNIPVPPPLPLISAPAMPAPAPAPAPPFAPQPLAFPAQVGPFGPSSVVVAPPVGFLAPLALAQNPSTAIRAVPPAPAPIQNGLRAKAALAVPNTSLSYLSVLGGQWWRTPYYVGMLNLTTEQQKKMDEVFQDARIKLIGLDADLLKAEVTLEPLMEAEKLDEARIVAQIDRVAAARAELEKANARMLLGIRQALTQDQWNQLRETRGKNALKADITIKAPKPAQR
jgi:Spy/CpxP family protein refolding chaperone